MKAFVHVNTNLTLNLNTLAPEKNQMISDIKHPLCRGHLIFWLNTKTIMQSQINTNKKTGQNRKKNYKNNW